MQPGVVRDQLNRILRPHGRYFPPDPSNTAMTTVGGMLGVDAAGSHSVRVGSTRDHVESIETVLADGTVVEFGEEPLTRTQLEAAFVADTALSAQPSGNGDRRIDAGGRSSSDWRRCSSKIATHPRKSSRR